MIEQQHIYHHIFPIALYHVMTSHIKSNYVGNVNNQKLPENKSKKKSKITHHTLATSGAVNFNNSMKRSAYLLVFWYFTSDTYTHAHINRNTWFSYSHTHKKKIFLCEETLLF